jgi:MFS family permease
MFGMASVWGAMEGLSVRDISIFIGAMYVGGLVLQYPIGWLSDRMDRRLLILGCRPGAAAMLIAGVGAALLMLVWSALDPGGDHQPACIPADRLYQRLPAERGHGRRPVPG